MMQSESIDLLAKAFVKAQGEFKAAIKASVNPYFSSKYADLTSVFAACREPLANNGLAIMQPLSSNEKGITVTTILLHESGQYIQESITVMPLKQDPQTLGSLCQYLKRYSAEGMLGISREDADDDGNVASQSAEPVKQHSYPSSTGTAEKGGPEPPSAPLLPEDGGGDWSKAKAISDLETLCSHYADLAQIHNDDARKMATAYESKDGKERYFIDFTKMRFEWQFNAAIEKVTKRIEELKRMESEDEGL